MSCSSERRVFCSLCVFGVFVLPVVAEAAFESPPGAVQDLQAVLSDLAVEVRTYVGSLVGEQTLLSVQKVSLADVFVLLLHSELETV